MALVELIDPTDVNITLDNAFGNRLRWQMSEAEYDNRVDEAAYAVAAILNKPYYEDDLTPEERARAEAEYARQPWAIAEKGA